MVCKIEFLISFYIFLFLRVIFNEATKNVLN